MPFFTKEISHSTQDKINTCALHFYQLPLTLTRYKNPSIMGSTSSNWLNKMQNVSSLIHAKWIIPVIPHNAVLTDHSLVIDNQRIIDLLPTQDCSTRYQSANEYTLPEHLITAGFVNAHTHIAMNLYRGLADDLPLMSWLQDHMWPAEQALMTPASTEIASELAIAEMISGGTTCFNDHYFFPDVTAKVVQQSGIRAALGLTFINVKNAWAEDENESAAKAQHLLANTPTHPRLHWVLAPHAPYTITDTTLTTLRELSAQYDIPVHIHLQESQAEIESSLTEYGMRPIARLDQHGLVNDKLLAVHMTQLTADEIALFRERGCHVIHCPESNLKLGSGIAPIQALLDAGINVALGTDGAASNNDLDMIGEMRTASLIAKGINHNPTHIPAATALAMATINGAAALGLDHAIGSLEIGKQADIIAIDLSKGWQQPQLNPLSYLVYSANANMVSHTWVAGQALLDDYRLTTLDIEAIKARANTLIPQLTPFVHHPK